MNLLAIKSELDNALKAWQQIKLKVTKTGVGNGVS